MKLSNSLSRIAFSLAALVAAGCVFAISVASAQSGDKAGTQSDWSAWRGPAGDGVAPNSEKAPTEWSLEKNVVWKVKVPGRGHASPIIVGDNIFLATADEGAREQSVVCFDRNTGKQKWQTVVNKGALNPKIHGKNTYASQTVATDGERVFVVFENNNKIQVAAVDFKGNKIWAKHVGSYQAHFPFGYGTSPIMQGKNVVITSDNKLDSMIVALDGKTGDEAWKIERHKKSSYSPPAIAKTGGKEQMFISGGKKIMSYNLGDGSVNWTAPARWDVSCGTMVWNDEMVFASGGFPASQTLAIDASTGTVKWENAVRVYEQSMLYHDGHLYGVSEKGAAYCWDAETGEEKWVSRLKNGTPQSASPIMANGNIYFTSETGTTHVVKADPASFQLVATNQLGNEAFASMAAVDGTIFARVATGQRGNDRQEWLVRLANQ